jgi:hypothetical protein
VNEVREVREQKTDISPQLQKSLWAFGLLAAVVVSQILLQKANGFKPI